jgi:hypothetical protein
MALLDNLPGLKQASKSTQGTAQNIMKANNEIKAHVAGLQQAQTGKAKTGAEFDLGGTTNAEDDGMDDLIAQATAQDKQAQIQDLGQQQQQTQANSQADQAKEAQKNKAVMAKETLATQTEELLAKFEQNMDALGMERYKSDVNQLLFGMRMQNTKYIDQLKMEGDKLRLNDKATFAEALMASSLQDEMTLLKGNLEFRQLMFADDLMNKGALARDDREFARRLQAIDIETALQAAFADNEARSEGMKFEAIAGMVSQIGKAATDYATTKKENPDKLGLTSGGANGKQD